VVHCLDESTHNTEAATTVGAVHGGDDCSRAMGLHVHPRHGVVMPDKPGGIYLSLVVPAFNEAQRIVLTLDRTVSYLSQQSYPWELLVVDDGSTDTTIATLTTAVRGDARIQVLANVQNSGKGYSVRRGVLEARGEIIGFMDADYKTPIEEIEKIVPYLRDGVDVVIGSRAAAGSTLEVKRSPVREMGSRVFSRVARNLMGLSGIHDTQCGFKFYQRAAAREIYSRVETNGYMFDIEALLIARRLGFKIQEVPLRWMNEPDSRFRLVRGTIENSTELLKIRMRTLRA